MIDKEDISWKGYWLFTSINDSVDEFNLFMAKCLHQLHIVFYGGSPDSTHQAFLVGAIHDGVLDIIFAQPLQYLNVARQLNVPMTAT